MKGILTEVLAVLIISIGNFFMSFIIAWSSYALADLRSDNSPIGYPISEYDGALIGSLPMLGSLIATPISGWMSDAIGRKKSEILIALCFALGWTILATAKYVTLIFLSRFILGMAMGAHIVVSMPLVSEIGTVKTRGPILSMLIFIYTLGNLGSYVAGWLMSYTAVNYLGVSLSVAYVILTIIFVKESPVYLIWKQNEKEALKSLKYYRGVSTVTPEVLDEFEYLKTQNCQKKHSESVIQSPEKEKLRQEESRYQEISAWKTLCTSKPTQRALFVCLAHIFLIPFGGTICVTAYASMLFQTGAPDLSPHMCSILLSLSFVLGSFVSTFLCGIMSRRSLQISSALLSSVLLSVLSSILRWRWAPDWLVPATVLAFCFVYQVGIGIVAIVQMGEMFLPKVKNLVSVMVSTVMSIGNFIVLFSFTPMIDGMGLPDTLNVFSSVCALTAILSYFTMKETKGKTVEEILEMFEKGIFTKNK
ncbi:sugar transporter domain-containing protein [Phthorimaea operculella]|nr:sugar transporter domain-containing protein [Phthorimaea operculella]